MTIKKFIDKTEENRGKFKNKVKLHAQLANIHTYGIKDIRKLCYESKLYGITFIETLAIELDRQEQREFMKEVRKLKVGSSIHDAKSIYYTISLRK